jgi:hypothetical protein
MANAAGLNLQQDFAVARRRARHILQNKRLAEFTQYRGSHSVPL